MFLNQLDLIPRRGAGDTSSGFNPFDLSVAILTVPEYDRARITI